MDERKEQLLGLIVEEYIKTAQPIGSHFLSQTGTLDVSAATIRNEMRELELEGFLVQPHTSAGRIPSEAGYRYYVDRIMQTKELPRRTQTMLNELSAAEADKKNRLKLLARVISEEVDNAVILAFNPDALYYTGIGHLFSQPEFSNMEHTVTVSSLFDKCEDIIDEIYERSRGERPHALIGSQNPFGSVCSLVNVRFGSQGLFSVLGPMRMNYAKTISLLHYVTHLA